MHKELNGNSLTQIKFHPDGGIFASGQVSGMIKLWDITTQQEFAKLEDLNMHAISNLSFSENGFYLASCGVEDTQIRIWDIRKNKVIKYIKLDEGNYANKIQFDNSGNYLSFAGHSVGVCDIKTMQITNKFEHKNIITCARFFDSSDNVLISTSLDGDFNIFS